MEEAAAVAKRTDVPFGSPITLRKRGEGKKPWTPMATAFLMRGGAGLMWRCGCGASFPRKYWRTCCQKVGCCTSRYVVWNSGSRIFLGSSLVFATSFGAGCADGAVSGRVGESTGDVLEGVTVLLEDGVSVTTSFGTVFARERPGNDRKDRLDDAGSSAADSCGAVEASVFGCSSSLN